MPNVIATIGKKKEEDRPRRIGGTSVLGGPDAYVNQNPPTLPQGTLQQRARQAQQAPSTPAAPSSGGVINTLMKPINELTTPEGGFKGTSTPYRIGESSRALIHNLAKPVMGGLELTGNSLEYLGGLAKDVYKGARGIPEETNLSMPTTNPISQAAAASSPQTRVVQRPSASSKRPTPPAQWTGGEYVTDMGSGLFATGQGSPTHQRWGVNQNGVISNLTLPIGQNPNQMNPADYQSLIEREEPAKGVSVIRGLREFKNGKEVRDDMTPQRQLASQIATMLSEYQKSVGAPPGGPEAANIISSLISGETAKAQSKIAANAAVRASQNKTDNGPVSASKFPLLDKEGNQVKDMTGEPILTTVPTQRIGDQVLFMDAVSGPRLVPIQQVRQGNQAGGRTLTQTEFDALVKELKSKIGGEEKSWFSRLFD